MHVYPSGHFGSWLPQKNGIGGKPGSYALHAPHATITASAKTSELVRRTAIAVAYYRKQQRVDGEAMKLSAFVDGSSVMARRRASQG
jgi:hypothetical protein